MVEMLEDRIRTIVKNAREGNTRRLVVDEQVPLEVRKAIYRYITLRDNPIEDTSYQIVQEAMSTAPGKEPELFARGVALVSPGVSQLFGAAYHYSRVAMMPEEDQALIAPVLTAHFTGEWSEMEEQDRILMSRMIDQGQRVASWHTLKEKRVMVVTEWDRSRTTILLPEEY